MFTLMKENQKIYIPNAPRVTWDSGEMCEFASCLVSALACRGEEIEYAFVMGTSGAAFRFTIAPGKWDFGNYSIRNISPDAYAPLRRACAAAGYACEIFESYSHSADHAKRSFIPAFEYERSPLPGGEGFDQIRNSFEEDRLRIMGSIERGVPVLAFGVVGPSDCCLVTGYDEGGEVLLGWSTYQDIPDDHNIPHDSTGYFRKPGWHAQLNGYLLLGEKIARPPLREVYLTALRWAVSLLRMPEMNGKATGLRGLALWAEEMTQAKYFPQGDEETLGWRYVSVAINMTMLRDHCLAEPFLRKAAQELPELAAELLQAADCYAEVARIRAEMDELIADNFSERAMKAIGEAETRQAYADAIRQIAEAENQAVGWIERMLERNT